MATVFFIPKKTFRPSPGDYVFIIIQSFNPCVFDSDVLPCCVCKKTSDQHTFIRFNWTSISLESLKSESAHSGAV